MSGSAGSTPRRSPRGWFAGLFSVQPHDRAHWTALRAALTLAIGFLLVWRLGHLDWTLYVAFGAFSSVYGRHHAYRDRLRMQAGAGSALVLAVVLGTAVSVFAAGSLLAVALMAVASVGGFLLSRHEGWLPPGSLFFVFGTGATSSFAHTAADIPLALLVCGLTVLLALGIGQAGRLFPAGRSARKAPSPVRVPFGDLLRAPGVRWDLLRYAIGPLVAGGVATLGGIGHPYWAAVSATIPLVGATLGAQFTRATHRLVGTLLGVLLAFAILSADPSDLVMILIVLVIQAFAELFVLRNYGLTVIALTPLALIMSHLASPVSITQLVEDRAVETVLGVAVAILLMLLVRPRRRAAPYA